jgi:hypothetical protein
MRGGRRGSEEPSIAQSEPDCLVGFTEFLRGEISGSVMSHVLPIRFDTLLIEADIPCLINLLADPLHFLDLMLIS